jgi:hypothetical protein
MRDIEQFSFQCISDFTTLLPPPSIISFLKDETSLNLMRSVFMGLRLTGISAR